MRFCKFLSLVTLLGVTFSVTSYAGSLSGYVWEQNSNQAISSAVVSIVSLTFTGDTLFYKTTSQSDGSYRIDNVTAGLYQAVCLARGYEPKIVTNVTIGQNVTTLDFHLKPLFQTGDLGEIAGKVVFDNSGAPVPNALIEFIGVARRRTFSFAFTDAKGEYVAQVPAGDYIVGVRYFDLSTGYIYHEYYDDVKKLPQAKIVTVIKDQRTSGIDFGIPIFAQGPNQVTFCGKVTDDTNVPLGEATVRIWAHGFRGLVHHSTKTDAQGLYSITFTANVHPWRVYMASAEKEGYQTEFYHEKPVFWQADPIFVFGDTVIENIDFTLSPVDPTNPNSISGKVTADAGTPLENAVVAAINRLTGEIFHGFTNAAGEYSVKYLSTGSYYVLFLAEGYVPELYDDVDIFHWRQAHLVEVSGPVTGIDASLSPLSSVNGQGVVAGKVLSANGSPLAGVLVTVQLANGSAHVGAPQSLLNVAGQTLGYAFTDSEGNYAVSGLGEGNYTITAAKIGYKAVSETITPSLPNGTTMVDFNLTAEITGVDFEETHTPAPGTYQLSANYPNPFNPSTTITFSLPEAQKVRLVIYDVLGHEVRELLNGYRTAGSHTVSWDGRDANGQQIASGIYLYSFETPNTRITRKMVLSK